jgi:hypothetical protein
MIPWMPPSSAPPPHVPSPTKPYGMTPSLAVHWSRKDSRYLPLSEPAYFPLYPIAETDPWFDAITHQVPIPIIDLPPSWPAYLPLYPIAETDPRFDAIAHQVPITHQVPIIDVAEAPFVLWRPFCVDEDRLHYRGAVAAALDATTLCDDGEPDLWIGRQPYLPPLRADAMEYRTWLLALAARRDVWFTWDCASLTRLLDVTVNADGELIIDVEQLAG